MVFRSLIQRFVLLVLCALYCAGSARADYVQILCDDEAFLARAMLIESACHEINVSYYTIEGDRASRTFLCLLQQAARRGVKVRVLVDGLKNKIPGELRQELVDHGVELRDFHQLLLHRPDWLNNRMHDKLLVVDARHMILGSRNIADEHFGAACHNYIDRDAYVYGCAPRAAHEYFMRRWESREVRPARLRHHSWNDFLGKDANHTWGYIFTTPRIDEPAPPPSLDEPDEIESLHSVPIRFLFDPPDVPKYIEGGIQFDVLAVLELARCEIIIESPYLVLSNEMLQLLLAARERGVRVSLLTNSAQSNDQKLAQAGYENQKRRLLRAGIDLWEFAGDDHLHAKSAVVDGRYSIIGSYNFDARSEKTNSEVAILIDDPIEAMYLAMSIDEHRATAYHIGPDGKPIGFDQRYPGAKPSRAGAIRALRFVTPFIKRLL